MDFKYPIFAISNEWDNILSGRSYMFNNILFINSELKTPGTKFKTYLEKLQSQNWFCRFIQKPVVWYKWIQDFYSQEKKLLRKQKKEIRHPDFLEASILVNTGHENILYTGRVKDYFLAKNNNIDKIYLEYATKESFTIPNEIERAENKQTKYKFSEEDLLVIKSDEIINIDIRIGMLE